MQLAAKHYYVQHGSESSMETAEKIVRECINMTLIESKSVVKLVQMIHSAHTQVYSIYSICSIYSHCTTLYLVVVLGELCKH